GFPDASARIHELWMAGRRDDAVAAVPDEYIVQSLLAGSADRIRAQWIDDRWDTRGLTGLIVRARTDDELTLVADLAGSRDESACLGPPLFPLLLAPKPLLLRVEIGNDRRRGRVDDVLGLIEERGDVRVVGNRRFGFGRRHPRSEAAVLP